MPHNGRGSYNEVTDEFLAHWALVDGVLPPGAGRRIRLTASQWGADGFL
jgi:hypothetical protein